MDDAEKSEGLTLRLRPGVPMHLLTCVPSVCALGICQGLRADSASEAAVRWPSDVAMGDALIRLRSHAGYEDGMYVDLTLSVEGDCPDEERLLESAGSWASKSCEEWERRLRTAGTVAGPLAPVLEDYFDALEGSNQQVDVIYPNGHVAASGVLCGVDVWGRVTVRLADGQEMDLAPEMGRIRPQG
jgi:BirA family biotin operon repressor/biotin-[acetyl-CoA-carboxylase] ligase